MEKNMRPRPAVSRELANFIPVELFTDRRHIPADQENQRLKLKLTNTATNPVYVILSPDEEVLKVESFTRDEGEFLRFLAAGLNGHLAKR
jgi:hypothetical protein